MSSNEQSFEELQYIVDIEQNGGHTVNDIFENRNSIRG